MEGIRGKWGSGRLEGETGQRKINRENYGKTIQPNNVQDALRLGRLMRVGEGGRGRWGERDRWDRGKVR